MEGLVILGLIVVLFWMARGKAGVGSAAEIEAQADLPRRPVSGGPHMGGPGNDLLDDRTGDAGARPRL
jgi:hypothetical protein